MQMIQAAASKQIQTAATVLSARAATLSSANPLHTRCGFVFSFGYYFYFFGYRQTPTRAGARTMPA
jgi:hypothetical protein